MSTRNPSFLDGWRTLPEELKLHILSLVLAPEPSESCRNLLTYHNIKEARFWNQYPFLGLAAPLLECDEIKPLVLEAFCTQHTFLLDYGSTRNNMIVGIECIWRPPEHIAKLIRRLKICFSASWLSKGWLQLLEDIAAETSRLDQLMSVDLHLSGYGPSDRAEYNYYLYGTANIQFKSKCLRVTCPGGRLDQNVHAPLLVKLDLHPAMGPTETTWTCLSKVFDASGSKDIYGSLQEVDCLAAFQSSRHYMRWTVKEVVVQKHYRLKPYTRLDKKHGLV
jgi:hypothetical protein